MYNHQKMQLYVGSFIGLVVFGIFIATVAPTVAFWDCGEYIGASTILGIPHPPGNPLYVLVGRVFSMVFAFLDQEALRINLISVLCGTASAVLSYLIIVRVTKRWFENMDEKWKVVVLHVGGATGAFFTVFGYTFWFSAVEASVYIPAMFMIIFVTWLSLKWYDSKSNRRDVYLVLISYLVFLGIGIHMMTMIAMAPVFLFIIFADKSKLYDWRLWVTAMLLASVIYNVSWFFWIAPILIVATSLMMYVEPSAKKQWKFCLYISIFALVGYSIHLYIPIRSNLHPMIDENHPATIDAFKQFLERKQYGSESMITRMFHRRGAWTKQFGWDGHMGFFGFLLNQFFHFGGSVYTDRNTPPMQTYGAVGGFVRMLLYFIPLVFVGYGIRTLFKKSREIGLLLSGLLLVGTIGLVLYMNFADGTKLEGRVYKQWQSAINRRVAQGVPRIQAEQEIKKPAPVHREVRIRDYFFTSGFMFFGMFVGIAAIALLQFLFSRKDKELYSMLGPIFVVLFLLSPILPIMQNYAENDRSKDWIPYDYAFNLLNSCEKDAILFTGGDNDTFPLWFMQEARGVRKDVSVVNLSLINTKWYVKQMKNIEPKVPILFSDEYIENTLDHKYNGFEKPIVYTMKNSGLKVRFSSREEKQILYIKDQLVLHIVDANNWKKPIYFASTVSSNDYRELSPYIKREGLVLRVTNQIQNQSQSFDIDRTAFLLDSVYKFRSIGDGAVKVSETSSKIISNYAVTFAQTANMIEQPASALKQEIDNLTGMKKDSSTVEDPNLDKRISALEIEYEKHLTNAIQKWDQCIALMPDEERWRIMAHRMLMAHKQYDKALKRANLALKLEPNNPEYIKMKSEAEKQVQG